MSLWHLLVDAAVVGVAGWVVALWARGLPAIKQILARPTTPIGQLRDGPAEVAGVIDADTPLLNLAGQKCVLISVEVHNEWSSLRKNKTVSNHEVSRQILCARGVSVRDASGTSRLNLDTSSVAASADPVRTRIHASDAMERCPHYADLIVQGADLTVIERSVRVGRRVLVSGHASPDELAEPQGYRDGVAPSHKLSATSERKLLVSSGTQGQALLRLAGPLIFATVILVAVGMVLHQAMTVAQRL